MLPRIAYVLALGALLGGCGSASDPGINIVATTGVAADLARHVAPDADVEQLVPEGASPHDFELSAQGRQALEEADLVVAIGAGLEPGISLEEVSTPVWELTAHSGEPLRGEADAQGDPHVWMDPTRVARALPALAEDLGDVDPGAAPQYARAADAYVAELRRLDDELRRALSVVRPEDRELVTSHASLAYFADRYDFDVLATAFPASGAEAEASAGRLDELIAVIARADVPAVFAQREDDAEALRLVAEEAGVAIEDDLVIESPGRTGGYVAMLRHDAELIAAALGDRP